MCKYILIWILAGGSVLLKAQHPLSIVEGAVQVGTTAETNPAPGTIRWNGIDLEGFNGSQWLSLTGRQIGSISDINGNQYLTLIIGSQQWMIENLRTNRYAKGTIIPKVTINSNWMSTTSGAYSWYDNDSSSYEEIYGKLYNWYSVSGDSLCPSGRHIPVDADWTTLTQFLEQSGYGYQGSGPDIAKSMASQINWIAGPDPGDVGYDPAYNNASGFSGSPGALCNNFGNFYNLGISAIWWSKTEIGGEGRYFALNSASSGPAPGTYPKTFGCSVRCVKFLN